MTAGHEDRLAQAHEQLRKAVEELRSGEDWAQMLATQARFHNYSWGNCLLIQASCPQATKVAGYRTWQSLGRQVRKGERAIPILAPVVTRRQDAGAEEATEEPSRDTTRVLRGFRVAYVFDISATDGDPLPEVRPQLLEGEAPTHLYDRLAAQVSEAGFTLLRAECSPANGSTDFLSRTVTVRPDLSPAASVKTLCHELAHVTLHEQLATELRGGCRGRAEVEAESVAYLVCATAGLDSGSYSFPYVARWADDLTVVTATATRVTSCASQIAKRAELHLQGGVDHLQAVEYSRPRAQQGTRARRQTRERSSTGRGR